MWETVQEYIETFLPNAASYGTDIDFLIYLVTVIVGAWFILSEVVLFYFIFRFSRKKNPRAQYVTGETESDKKWIKTPHKLILICDVVILYYAILVWYDVKQTLPQEEGTLRIRIVAQQWAWTFVHPGEDGLLDTEDDIVTVDKLHLKNNTMYHFELQSKDVLHSLGIPVFRLTQDIIPGRTISGWFKPILTGEWDIQCRELCGIGHGLMPARVLIVSEDDHKKWISEQTPFGPFSVSTTIASTN